MNKKIAITLMLFVSLISRATCMEEFRNNLSKHYFYKAVYDRDYIWTENHLKAGFDPNTCIGDAGWYDANPLKVICGKLVGSYKKIRINETYEYEKNITYPGLDVFCLLVKYGVNINKYPYIWQRVYSFNNDGLNDWWRISESVDVVIPKNKRKTRKQRDDEYIKDANVLLEALILAGADPNMKGHPFPYSHSRILLIFNDKWAKKYFNSPEATTPLYEAIKKGSKWESHVDLLLEYGATLDESCLDAARLSGDKAMIEKVERLMNGAI